MTTPPEYAVFLGVSCVSNPGRHAIAMVVVSGARRDEWAKRLAPEDMTTPRAWLCAMERALVRVDRPAASVTLIAHDQQMVRLVADGRTDGPHADLLAAIARRRGDAAVVWVAKRDLHPEMERAALLAQQAIAGRHAA